MEEKVEKLATLLNDSKKEIEELKKKVESLETNQGFKNDILDSLKHLRKTIS
jgi:predicted RNase H-like nuclease (RuvC/YqgF family)